MTAALAVQGLSGGYRSLAVFREASFAVEPGQTLGILGPNGAGKSTLLKTIAGLLPTQAGSVLHDGVAMGGARAHRRARTGLVLVPEGRQILAELTVQENLDLGRAAGRLGKPEFAARSAEVLAIFPRLAERRRQKGGALSGGEQQMLAIARALLLDPTLLMLDEPTQGLAPIMIRQVLVALQALKGRFAMVVVEQNRAFLDTLADVTLTMRNGRLAPDEKGTNQ
ncbi:MAG: transporter ATP-binding protein [Rhodospirillales bacterium]|nr:transporter ATP-binding protein [Rhodospirillales bacterium]